MEIFDQDIIFRKRISLLAFNDRHCLNRSVEKWIEYDDNETRVLDDEEIRDKAAAMKEAYILFYKQREK